MTGGRGETRWVPGDTMQKKSTEPGVGPAEALVYNPLFLVQLCADTPFSRRPLALTRSGHNTWRGSCRDSHLRSYPYYRHSSFCLGDHAFRQMQEPLAGPEHPQYYPPTPHLRTAASAPTAPPRATAAASRRPPFWPRPGPHLCKDPRATGPGGGHTAEQHRRLLHLRFIQPLQADFPGGPHGGVGLPPGPVKCLQGPTPQEAPVSGKELVV